MNFKLEPMPYEQDALEPHISARTISYHYNKHHQGYLTKLDAALPKGDARRDQSLEEIIKSSDGGVFNCAAQVWNHSFYWQSLDPTGKTSASKDLAAQIDSDFGNADELKSQLKTITGGQFGSGWGWLVWNNADSKLQVVSTTDAENPMTDGLTPLLTLDVWEHAYYLDYQNDRAAYLGNLVDQLLNWEFASRNFANRNG